MDSDIPTAWYLPGMLHVVLSATAALAPPDPTVRAWVRDLNEYLVPVSSILMVAWLRYRLKRPPVPFLDPANLHIAPDYFMAGAALLISSLLTVLGRTAGVVDTHRIGVLCTSAAVLLLVTYAWSLALNRAPAKKKKLTMLEVVVSNTVAVVLFFAVAGQSLRISFS